MNTVEKIRLITDLHAATHALGRILDGGHEEIERTEALYTECMAALATLTMLRIRLVEQVGTDNL